MNYPTRLDDNTNILIEAPAAGGISKSQTGFSADPDGALTNALELIAQMARKLSVDVGNALDGTGMDFEVKFSVRADGNGIVMVSQHASEGQLQCTLSYKGDRNTEE